MNRYFQLFVFSSIFLFYLAGCQVSEAGSPDEMVVDEEELLLSEKVEVVTPFVDVAFNHWAVEAILSLNYDGLIKGYEDSSFKPDEPLTEGQFLLFVLSFFDAFGLEEIPVEPLDQHMLDNLYEKVDDYNFPLQGFSSKEKMEEPINIEAINETFALLYNDDMKDVLDQALASSFEKNKVVTRAAFVNFLYETKKNELHTSVTTDKLNTLTNTYLLEQKEEEEREQHEREEKLKKEQEEREQRELVEKLKKEAAQQKQQNDAKTKTETFGQSHSAEKEKDEPIQDVKTVAAKPNTPPTSYNAGISMTDSLLPSANSRERTTNVTHVMVHFMSNGLNKPNDPFHIQDIRSLFTSYGVSAHYVIDRNGAVYRFVPEDRVAFHAGKGNLKGFPAYKDKMNDYSIGIELLAIGTKQEMLSMIPNFPYDSIDPAHIGYTDAQYASLNNLLNDIYSRYPTISKSRKHVIGHDEYAPGRKTDPGTLFNWSRIGF
ncbi:N-acetylmuramoyl-L-alanine amidase [Sutcliffiella cohnii]